MLAVEARENRNAIGAALLMHGLLAAALLFSLQWNQRTPPVQAELWSGLPRNLPAVVAPPAPAVKPAPPAPAPPAPQEKADISLQKKKDEPKKVETKKADPPKEDPQKERERQEAIKKAAERKNAERKLAEEKLAEKRLAERKAAEQLEAQRKAELARLLGTDPNAKPGAQGKDAATKTGVAAGGAEIGNKTGMDAEYEAMIQARIRLRITYFDRSNANPEAIVRVDQLPTGEVIGVKLTQASGTPAWDEAVQRAVWAASPLPKRKDGTVARVLELTFRPKEAR